MIQQLILTGLWILELKGKIVEIAPEISETLALENFDVAGLYVVPGIIDIHNPFLRLARRQIWS